MKRETTPVEITDRIMELCSGAVPGTVPVYIPVEAAGLYVFVFKVHSVF